LGIGGEKEGDFMDNFIVLLFSFQTKIIPIARKEIMTWFHFVSKFQNVFLSFPQSTTHNFEFHIVTNIVT
jgi:hypothetical protein